MASENKVRLAFTPQVQHGELKANIKPAADGSGWSYTQQATIDKYSELSWDVTLAPDDFLLVGCRFESKHTFGKECFVRIDETRPVQRLLVIRAARQQSEPAGAEVAEENLPPSR
jgi:hypothetical protein